MPDVSNSAMIHVPTLRERFWRALGFRYHLGDEPEGTEKMRGWMRTSASIDFSFLDRVRLLLTGRLRVELSQHTTVQVDQSLNRLDWQIKAPGEQ